MKTLMKILLVSLFSIAAFVASAQSTIVGSRPGSKAVQNVSNKWLVNEQLATVVSLGYQTQALSKDVQLVSNRLSKEPKAGNMKSVGYPVWTIQKRVHKVIQPSRPEKAPVEVIEDLISRMD